MAASERIAPKHVGHRDTFFQSRPRTTTSHSKTPRRQIGYAEGSFVRQALQTLGDKNKTQTKTTINLHHKKQWGRGAVKQWRKITATWIDARACPHHLAPGGMTGANSLYDASHCIWGRRAKKLLHRSLNRLSHTWSQDHLAGACSPSHQALISPHACQRVQCSRFRSSTSNNPTDPVVPEILVRGCDTQ